MARTLICIFAITLVFALIASGTLRKASASGNQADSPQTVFTNATAITINDADIATPYPSDITVSGLATSIPATPDAVQVTFNSFSHTFPDDVGIVLVGPTGAALLLQDGAGDDPDLVNVTYTLSDSGATFLPGTTAWTTGTYKPTSYFTGDSFPAPGPGTSYNLPGPVTGGTATFQSTFAGTNPNGVWHLYVVDFVGGDDGAISGGWSLTINAGAAVTPQHVVDFDGDGKTDVSVVRNQSGQYSWYILQSQTNTLRAVAWGATNDRITPGDFTGDGKTDIAVWRPGTQGTYYILQSENNSLRTVAWGTTDDEPRKIRDYDGDGKADPCVIRNTGGQLVWYILRSATNSLQTVSWGQAPGTPFSNNDVGVPSDYDGDGKADVAVYRPTGAGGGTTGVFYVLRSSDSSLQSQAWGIHSIDYIVPGDYDGDGKADFAVWRGPGVNADGNWYIVQSTNGAIRIVKWGNGGNGLVGDLPVPGDYDGDGKFDCAVIRRGFNSTDPITWYILRSSDGGVQAVVWGLGDGNSFGNDFAVPIVLVE